jgi:cephalosporin hydroxylase
VKYGGLIAECDPMQNPWEMNEVLTFLEVYEIRTVLEIGMYQGGTFACWSRALEPSHLVGVTRDEVELVPEFMERVCRDRTPMPTVDLFFGLSQEPAIHAAAGRALDGKPVDFLFIDGGHTYDEVSRDFELYAPLVRLGGVVGIHDVNPGAADVNRFWHDWIRMTYRSVLVCDAAVGSGGLGIGLVLV